MPWWLLPSTTLAAPVLLRAESGVFLDVEVTGCGEPAVSTATGPHLAGPPFKWVCSWGGAGGFHKAIGEKVQL